jgi:Uma2 family endonuclease
MQVLTKPLTITEFRQMEFEEYELKEYIFELLAGEIMKQNYPSFKHQQVSMKMILKFGNFITKKNLGTLLHPPFGVVLDDFNAPQPDLIFVSTAKQAIIQAEGVFGVPDLLVEIISPSSIKTDKFDKYKIYEKFGVAEYWLIDPKNQSIEVYSLQNSKYELAAFGVEKGKVQSVVIQGLEIEVSEIFC